jgi:hypothetical protein
MRRLALWTATLALVACSTRFSRAEDLAKQGKYLQAAAIFEQLAHEKPKDRDIVQRRDLARWRALEQLLAHARQYRRKGDHASANGKLEAFLMYRARWETQLNGALESSLEDELEAVKKYVEHTVATPARAGLALTAEQALAQVSSLLAYPQLGNVRGMMTHEVLQGGKSTCEKLKAAKGVGTAHWVDLVFRYCKHFQQVAPEPPLLAETGKAMDLVGELRGFSPAHDELLRSVAARAFEASPWYSPQASRRVAGALRGTYQSHSARQPVQLEAPWIEQVPYTAYETVQESFQEPYSEQETYSYPCGNKTCTDTRTVTKYRTAYRDVTKEVTRYRQEARIFVYRAIRASIDYRLSLILTAEVEGGRAPMTASHSDRLEKWGYDHDARFAPANVHPSRADLPLSDVWLERGTQKFAQAVRSQLLERWRQSYCSAAGYTVDEAARCARAGTPLPAGAASVLEPLLADDTRFVHFLYLPAQSQQRSVGLVVGR